MAPRGRKRSVFPWIPGPAFDVALGGRLLGLMRSPDAPMPPANTTVTVVMNVLSAAQRAEARQVKVKVLTFRNHALRHNV